MIGKRRTKGWNSVVPSLSPDVIAKNMTACKQRYSVQMSRTYYGTGIQDVRGAKRDVGNLEMILD